MTRFGPPVLRETLEAAWENCGNIEEPKAAPIPVAIVWRDFLRLIMLVRRWLSSGIDWRGTISNLKVKLAEARERIPLQVGLIGHDQVTSEGVFVATQ